MKIYSGSTHIITGHDCLKYLQRTDISESPHAISEISMKIWIIVLTV